MSMDSGPNGKARTAEEFHREYNRLHRLGNYVVLAHAQNLLNDVQQSSLDG